MADIHTRGGSRPRVPGFVYLALTIAVAMVVAVLTLTARQPPPPSIAEFAPNAVERITEAPPEQGEGFGLGDGSIAGPSGLVAGQAAPKAVIDVPRVKRCVGDPPRQIEDPQSPPCIAYWEGDNGGATYQGVTENEITVAIPDFKIALKELETFFNNRFQFYGRRLLLKPYTPRVGFGNSGGGDPSGSMRADAVYVDEEMQAFASSTYTDPGAARDGQDDIYYDELARRHVISVNGRPTMQDEEQFEQMAPYEWSWLPGEDIMGKQKAEWICVSLKDRPAAHAGGVEQGKPRVFGLIYAVPSDRNQIPPLDPMRATLQACGIKIAAEGEATGVGGASNLMIDMQSKGVTSIICECNQVANQLQQAATRQGFFPEWLIGTYLLQDSVFHGRLGVKGQQDHAFGLSWWNKIAAAHDKPSYWAIRESNPSFSFGGLDIHNIEFEYAPLLLLASGIQMAGPRLTPQTFRQGLFRTRFPNPGAGAPPSYQPSVAFPSRYYEVHHPAIIRWSNDEVSPLDGQPGTWCYYQHGARYGSAASAWPTDLSRLFQGECQ